MVGKRILAGTPAGATTEAPHVWDRASSDDRPAAQSRLSAPDRLIRRPTDPPGCDRWSVVRIGGGVDRVDPDQGHEQPADSGQDDDATHPE